LATPACERDFTTIKNAFLRREKVRLPRSAQRTPRILKMIRLEVQNFREDSPEFPGILTYAGRKYRALCEAQAERVMLWSRATGNIPVALVDKRDHLTKLTASNQTRPLALL